MELTSLPFDKIPQVSDTDKAYASRNDALLSFAAHPPTYDGLKRAMELRKFFKTDRDLLANTLTSQYAHRHQLDDHVKEIVGSLKRDNTFTITTAHQPCLFGGPLYFVYKILSAIKLAKQCKEKFPDFRFVPVFVLGGEDHDLEEMDHLHLFGKRVKWDTEQAGPVGRMSTDGIDLALKEVMDILGDSPAAEQISTGLRASFGETGFNYGDAMLHWVANLFKGYELLVLSMDDPGLKRAFIPEISKELFHQASIRYIEPTQEKLESEGFKPQAYTREINLFYLDENGRNRIELEGDTYRIVNTDIVMTRDELDRVLHDHPERFSPNVVVRPLYQEFILPNIAYVGGGGEIAYWLERKEQFSHFGVPFPVLVRRDSILWVGKGNYKLMKELEISAIDLFRDTEDLKKEYVHEHSDVELELSKEKGTIEEVYETLSERAGKIDEGLKKWVLAEGARQVKALDHVEKRLIRAEKQQHDVSINRIEKLKDKLFPENGLQERYDNFMQHYLQFGEWYFQELLKHMDPLDMQLKILLPNN